MANTPWYWNGDISALWENVLNWGANADGSGAHPATAPWLANDITADDDLHFGSLASVTPIISIASTVDSSVTGTCDIDAVVNNGGVNGGIWTGDGFDNEGIIGGGTFSGTNFYNDNVIRGGTFFGAGFIIDTVSGSITGGVFKDAAVTITVSGGRVTFNITGTVRDLIISALIPQLDVLGTGLQ